MQRKFRSCRYVFFGRVFNWKELKYYIYSSAGDVTCVNLQFLEGIVTVYVTFCFVLFFGWAEICFVTDGERGHFDVSILMTTVMHLVPFE